jgi:23S rRNA (guanosine2251-2'-O)-methyltransferase
MKREIILILDNLRSRENVGSIFRTADAAGVSKIYLCGITPTPRMNNELRIMNNGSDKISKTALGAEEWVPWEYRRDTWRIITELRKKGVKIIALEQTEDAVNIFKLKTINHKMALVVGNEVKGISPKIMRYCDKKVAIPMYGKKESLNVSVATGIALYNLIQ